MISISSLFDSTINNVMCTSTLKDLTTKFISKDDGGPILPSEAEKNSLIITNKKITPDKFGKWNTKA